MRSSPSIPYRASVSLALVFVFLCGLSEQGQAQAKPPTPTVGTKSASPTAPPPTAATPPAAPAQATGSPPAAEPAPQAPAPCVSTENLLRGARTTSKGVTGWMPRTTDDTLAEEGTFWSNADAVVVPATARIEYDMGGPKTISAMVLQGDNNDEYVIEGSLDGSKFSTLWIAPPTFVGMGLRTRWTALTQPSVARYVRITGRGGDNFYSVSEVQALCKKPAIFPPKLKLPPKKYGWDALDNDGMVNVKGIVSLIAAVLLALSFVRRFYQARIQSPIARFLLIGLFASTSAISAWLGGLADTGTCPPEIATWARAHTPGTFYGVAAIAIAISLGLLAVAMAQRAYVIITALVIALLSFGTTISLWLAAVAANGGSFETVTKWAKVHGSAPGFYYTAVLLFSTAIAVACLCLRREGPRLFDTSLAIVGLFSFFAWWNIGHYHFDHYIHIWEHYHYIMGAKYPELRYQRLYQCTGVADSQDGLKNRVKARKVRRIESDNRLGTTDEILAHPELCTSHFKDSKRWDQFRADIRFFRGRFSLERWDESQNDHGYNATPVWAIMGRWLSERYDLTWDNIVKLGLIDSIYLVGMWFVVLWAFGWRAAAVAAVYWGGNFPARFYWNGGSFLRYDWQLWLIVGICLLRKRKQFWGGAALTYATLLRVFPGFVVAAIVLKALHAMWRERRIFLSREHQAFAAGCIVALGVLMPASGWATNGLDAWPEFAINSKKHLATALTNNMGLKTVMGYDFPTRAIKMRNDKLEDPFQEWKDAKEYFYHKRAPLFYLMIALFCVLLARAGDREEDDWVAACLGTGLIVIGAELTCYYYGFLLTYGLLWDRRRMPGILAALLSAFTCFIYDWVSWNDDHFAAMSLASVVVVVAVTAISAFGKRAGVHAQERPPERPLLSPAQTPSPATAPQAPSSMPPAFPEPH